MKQDQYKYLRRIKRSHAHSRCQLGKPTRFEIFWKWEPTLMSMCSKLQPLCIYTSCPVSCPDALKFWKCSCCYELVCPVQSPATFYIWNENRKTSQMSGPNFGGFLFCPTPLAIVRFPQLLFSGVVLDAGSSLFLNYRKYIIWLRIVFILSGYEPVKFVFILTLVHV